MAKTAVLYQSHYGSTKLYAQHIAGILNADLYDLALSKGLDYTKYDTIVFGGGLYAGKINGIKFLAKNTDRLVGKNLVVFTVGIGDPALAANARSILKSAGRALPKELMKTAHIYSFRGSLDYSGLKFAHRMMMKILKGVLSKKKEEELTDDDKTILQSFSEKVDYTDTSAALPLLEYVSRLK
ncbi:MAG: flavodoxin domain-containing protein [Oscillospiraceae bacterium]|nr:flavodoxin domain-containing protein [Oscillospiraceae bacterium]